MEAPAPASHNRSALMERLADYIQENEFCGAFDTDATFIRETVRLNLWTAPQEDIHPWGVEPGEAWFVGNRDTITSFVLIGSQRHLIGARNPDPIANFELASVPLERWSDESGGALWEYLQEAVRRSWKAEVLAVRHKTRVLTRFDEPLPDVRLVEGSPIYIALV